MIHIRGKEAEIVEAGRQGKTCRVLAAQYNVAASTISNIFRRHEFKPPTGRKPSCEVDHHAFDVITEESAYWMGFLCADGSIVDNGGAPQVVLGLAQKDRDHVVKFRDFLKSTHAVTDSVNKSSKGYKNGLGGKASSFRVRSNDLVAALRKHGLGGKSPERTPGPHLEDSVHFWRGEVDGDGTVRLHIDPRRNYRYPHIMLCGHMPLLEKFQAFLIRRNIAANITDTSSGVYQIRLMGSGALILIRLLYGSATVALDRKLHTAKELLKEFDH